MLTAHQQHALDAMYRDHAEPLVRWLRRRYPNVADDAAAETWAIVTRLGPDHIRPDTVQAFLRTVAKHEAVRLIRAGTPEGAELPLSLEAEIVRVREDEATSLREQIPQPASDREHQAHAELSEMLDAIGHLSRGQRVALIGRIVGLTYDEIGDAAGHPTTEKAAAKSTNTWANRRVQQGKQQLRRRLEG